MALDRNNFHNLNNFRIIFEIILIPIAIFPLNGRYFWSIKILIQKDMRDDTSFILIFAIGLFVFIMIFQSKLGSDFQNFQDQQNNWEIRYDTIERYL